MRLIYILCIIFLGSCTSTSMISKLKIEKAPPGYFIALFQEDHFLDSLRKEYEFTIIKEQRASSLYGGQGYQFLCLKKKKWYTINYHRKYITNVGESSIELTSKRINPHKADSIIKIFIDNNFANIPDRDFGCLPEEYGLDPKDKNPKKLCVPSDHSYTFKLTIFNKSKYCFKEYTDVIRMNNCCPGNKNREVFIKCWNALESVK